MQQTMVLEERAQPMFFNSKSALNDSTLDQLFECSLMINGHGSELMRCGIMNDGCAAALDPSHKPNSPLLIQCLELPQSNIFMANDASSLYRINEDNQFTFSPSTSYSSPSSTDTNNAAGFCLHHFNDSYYHNQNLSDMSSATLSSPETNRPLSPLPPRVYKPCVVCSDKSSGYHYTVSSCEGCKGFFRRSVQKNMQYICHKEKSCEINKITRNRCQHCRFKKCLEMGMSKEAVRSDRKKKKLKMLPHPYDISTPSVIDRLTDQDRKIIETVYQAHHDTFPDQDSEGLLTNHDDHTFLNIDFHHELYEIIEKTSISESNQVTDMILWGRVSELSEQGIEQIVKFAKRVPGFHDITQNDRITLLKAAALEILILRLCLRYDSQNDVILFSCGMALNRSQIKVGGFGKLTDEFLKLADLFKKLKVDETTIALLSAVCLISSDRSGLENMKAIDVAQGEILLALEHYVCSKYNNQRSLFANLLYTITDLRKISIEGAEEVLKLSRRQSKISPLLDELLCRQENVDLTNPTRLSDHVTIPEEISKHKNSEFT